MYCDTCLIVLYAVCLCCLVYLCCYCWLFAILGDLVFVCIWFWLNLVMVLFGYCLWVCLYFRVSLCIDG